jgi:NitT/TauT family transport system substrate-binding protein
VDPIASSLEESAADATEVGLLDPVDLDGIYDLTLLNEVLDEAGEPRITAP